MSTTNYIAAKNQAEAVIAKVKRLVLRQGGANGIRALSRAFKIVEDDGTKTVNKEQFVQGLQDYGLTLTSEDLEAVWRYFDRNGDGCVMISEFITALRCGLNPERRTLVQRVFASFDKDNGGSVSVSDLQSRFDASRHPKVIRGESSSEEVHNDFINSFDTQTNPEGIITKQEFEQYYAGVSALIESDDFFAAMMRGCWRLKEFSDEHTMKLALRAFDNGKDNAFHTFQDVSEKERLIERAKYRNEFADMIKQHRQILLKSKLGFRGVGRLLREKDVHRTRFVSQAEFLDALWKNRLYLDNKALLRFLDTNDDGMVDYGLYMNNVVGELPPSRKLMLERLWKSFPTDRRSRTELSWIHRKYRAPDGVTLNHFLDAWDQRLVPDGKVVYLELEEWFAPLSEATRADIEFENALKQQWAL